MKHPKDMGEMEIEEFLTDLAARGKVSASTQNQAFNALLFLYRQVLKIDLFGEINALRAKTPERLPTVLTVYETFAVIDAMPGTHQLKAKILYERPI
jgi:site-specific recombinase XerD